MSDSDNTVCDIDLILKIRLLFGFHNNLLREKIHPHITKTICAIIGTIVIFFNLVTDEFEIKTDAMPYIIMFEYISYFLCSLLTDDQYLVDYYGFIESIDSGAQKTYQQIKRYVIAYFVYTSLYHTILNIFFYIYGLGNELNRFSIVFICAGCDIGSIQSILIFFLLYYRIKAFHGKVKSVQKHCEQFDGSKYVRIYIDITERFRKFNVPVKCLMLTLIIKTLVTVSYMQYNVFRFYSIGYYSLITIVFIAIAIVKDYMILFLPAIIFEGIAEEIDNLKIYAADRVLFCLDERQRAQYRLLLHQLRRDPLTFRVCHALPIDRRLPLSFLSFASAFILCMLQFNNILNSAKY